MAEIPDVIPSGPVESGWGNAIRDRVTSRYADAAARDLSEPIPQIGQITWLDTPGVLEFWNGSSWQLVDAAPVAATSWIIPTLLNGWANFGGAGTQAPTAYRRDAAGNVHIQGTLAAGTTTPGTVVFVLDVGFRPLTGHLITLGGTTAPEPVSWNIRDTGDVDISAGADAALSSMLATFSVLP